MTEKKSDKRTELIAQVSNLLGLHNYGYCADDVGALVGGALHNLERIADALERIADATEAK